MRTSISRAPMEKASWRRCPTTSHTGAGWVSTATSEGPLKIEPAASSRFGPKEAAEPRAALERGGRGPVVGSSDDGEAHQAQHPVERLRVQSHLLQRRPRSRWGRGAGLDSL